MSTSSLTLTLTGLQVLTTFKISVAAETSKGRGPFSADVISTTSEVYFSSKELQHSNKCFTPSLSPSLLSFLSSHPLFFPAKASRPRAPQMLTAETINATSVILNWRPPLPVRGEPQTSQTAVAAYIVSYTGSDEEMELPPSVTNFTVHGLTPRRAYNFTVAASNTFGVGEAANVHITLPPATPPTGEYVLYVNISPHHHQGV